MSWQLLSILPNVDLRSAIEAQHAAIVPPADDRVAALREEHPTADAFLSKFRTAHGRIVQPAVMLRHENASKARCAGEAMVGLRNCLSVATITHQWALALRYPNGPHRIAFSDAFDFYAWSLGRDYDVMISFTPAIMALHHVDDFVGQPAPGVPIQPLHLSDMDRPLLAELLTRWSRAYQRQRMGASDIALFRSLNMANTAMAMPAVQGATIFDYGRQCALWISAFEILAHFDAGQGRADLPAVIQLLGKKPFLIRSLRRRSFTMTYRKQQSRVPLPMKLYALLYQARNAFLHGNPVSVSDLKLHWSGRPILHFAPLLYRCALRNYLDLRYVSQVRPSDLQAGLNQRFAQSRFEEPQADAEDALRLATSKPSSDD